MADRETSLRASDAERERVVEQLGEQLGTGRLEPAEFEERMSAAYAARTRGELAVLLADLPAGDGTEGTPAPSAPATRRAGRRPGPSGRERGWASAGGAYGRWAVTGVVCLLVWATVAVATGDPGYFWPMWVIGPWGLVLLAGRLGHGLGNGRGVGFGVGHRVGNGRGVSFGVGFGRGVGVGHGHGVGCRRAGG